MSVHLLIPGFPGKSSKAGHSGEAELAGFQMGPRQIGEMIQWTRLKPGSTGAFSVVLDLTENADFWYRLRIAEATEMKIPLAWVIPGPQITYMFWGVRVSGFIVGNDGASSTILFEFEGVSGSYTRS